MVRTLKSLTHAGEEIKGLPVGTIILLQDDHDLTWRYFFAHGDSFVRGDGTPVWTTLKHPDTSVHSQGSAYRLIPHIDGPIIEDSEGHLTQNGKPFCHQSGIPTFQSIPSISRGGDGLTVNFPNGSPCVNLTQLVPELTDYDHIEQHRKGLLISRGNCLWLAVTN